MVLPALLVGAEAIRSNRLERRALQALGESMARTRTYAELETAMFDQGEIVWRYLSGLDPGRAARVRAHQRGGRYWQQRWRAELRPDEAALADGVAGIQRQIVTAAESVFTLADAGRRDSAYRSRPGELKGRLQPALTQMNRSVPPRARVERPRRVRQAGGDSRGAEGRRCRDHRLSLAAGLLGSWLISRGLLRPLGA